MALGRGVGQEVVAQCVVLDVLEVKTFKVFHALLEGTQFSVQARQQ